MQSSENKSGQRITTPLVLQSHVAECGAACLGSILAYFGLWVPLSELRERCEISRDGSSAAGIKRAAQSYGVKCVGLNIHEVDGLRDRALPLILFWEFHHFVILEGYDTRNFYINDPSMGRRRLSHEQFVKSYTGIVLAFELGEDFQPGGKRASIFEKAHLWLKGSSRLITWCICFGLLLILPVLAMPLLVMVFVDDMLADNAQWGLKVTVALIVTALLTYLLTLFKQRWLKRLASRVSVIVADRTVSQLLRLPHEFFSHRYVGDLVSRLLSIDKIARGFTQHFLQLLIELVMMIVFLSTMAVFSPAISLAVLVLTIINFFLVYLVAGIERDKSTMLRREQGLLAGIAVIMFNAAETLRMTGNDDNFFARWSGHQAREIDARQGVAEYRHISTSLSVLFMILGHATVIIFGSHLAMSGNLTLGELTGLYILTAMFLSSATYSFEFINARQMIEADIQRLDDITSSILKTENIPDVSRSVERQETISTLNGQLKLSGHVELRNVTFGYNRSKKPLIEDFTLTIEPGQRVALIGSSGSGKSTVAQVVAGLYEPWSGEILYDGHPLPEIPRDIISRSISLVDQHVRMFTSTVRENITLWNPSIPEETMIAAAEDASIHDVILSRPYGYATQVDEDGANFSGGQKQRLEIARSLASEPVFLILDEATSALDAATEELIDRALRRRGMSCLIIAHRLSTIRDCDQIIVLDKGGVVQRGIHEELVADRTGLYYQLVQAG